MAGFEPASRVKMSKLRIGMMGGGTVGGGVIEVTESARA